MILRKPYAFFIRMFKPIHLALGVLIGYLLFLESRMFGFLDKNIYSSLNFVGQNIKSEYVSNNVYIIPIIVIVLFTGILTVMYYKKKPMLFYVIGIFAMIVILVININSINFFTTLEESIVSIKNAKLIHDLVFISMLIEGVLLIFVLIRGAGVNIKKFNFDSDISKIDIKDSDNEEFEVNIEFNIDKTKREHKRRIRYLKYAYAEKKLLINIVVIVVVLMIGLCVFVIIKNQPKVYSENELVNTNTCDIIINNSYIVSSAYDGKKITDNSLIVVDTKIKSNYMSAKVYLKDFNINIGNAIYTPTTMYNKYLIDLGNGYYDADAIEEYTNYLFVYEIPSDLINKKIIFTYNDGEKTKQIRINPAAIEHKNNEIVKNISEELSFNDRLSGIKFKINSYEIQDRFTLNYRYCISENDCINSIEYIKGSIDENFDKAVIKLNVEYENNSDMKMPSFYNLLTTYGYIEYRINDMIKTQNKIELINSTKLNEKNVMYLGVNNEIKSASEVSLVFNIRGVKYIYKVGEL